MDLKESSQILQLTKSSEQHISARQSERVRAMEVASKIWPISAPQADHSPPSSLGTLVAVLHRVGKGDLNLETRSITEK